jgi:UDP-N-acetylglucosamine acyltransferase
VAQVVVDNDTHLGARNVIFPFASVGSIPQDLKFKGEAARLVIGDDNVIREGATLNIGTEATMETRIGNHCLLMAYSHVAHDCVLGDHVILTNSVGLAGHVHVGSWVTFGGLSAVHQFCRLGDHAFVAGGGMVTQDVPPFCIAQGDRAQLVGINIVGLKRRGWSRERIHAVRAAFKHLFESGAARGVALDQVERERAPGNDDVRLMTDFVRQSTRGVCSPRVVEPPADNFEG